MDHTRSCRLCLLVALLHLRIRELVQSLKQGSWHGRQLVRMLTAELALTQGSTRSQADGCPKLTLQLSQIVYFVSRSEEINTSHIIYMPWLVINHLRRQWYRCRSPYELRILSLMAAPADVDENAVVPEAAL